MREIESNVVPRLIEISWFPPPPLLLLSLCLINTFSIGFITCSGCPPHLLRKSGFCHRDQSPLLH